jgi:polyribonucleotide nucleotidyltransferase
MKETTKSIEIGGRTLTLTTGKLASQADAAVLARYGDTMVLVTVVASFPREDLDYFPLHVEFVERLYAGGRIKGSRWVKREGRPSDEAVLTARLVDRSIRPLFPEGYWNEVQVVVTVLSVDSENDPGVLSAVATSAALSISPIPWQGPVGTVRVGLKDGTPFVNPVNGELEFSDMDLVVTCAGEKIVMLETGAKEVPDEQMLTAIEFGQKETVKIIKLIEDFTKAIGKKKEPLPVKKLNTELKKKVVKLTQKDLPRLIKMGASDTQEGLTYQELKESVEAELSEEKKREIARILDELFKEEVRKMVLAGKRPDGRKIDEIRPLEMSVGILPRTHGSALFKRGQTQVLTVTTLGSLALEQLIESAVGEESKRFLHHYNMPPFAIGETGYFGWPKRREIGHGSLVEKALGPVVPSEDKFPYTIRLVSEILSSNGSSSMASVCGSSLSLMDAGVPISSAVAGIALGLFTDKKKTVVVSDILGLEDACGEMDFKIAGTQKGITAMQMDVKNDGLTKKVLSEAIVRAKKDRLLLFKKMAAVIPSPRRKLSQYAPKVAMLKVPVDKIGEVIGPGGKMIRKIIADTGASVDVEDDGTVSISAPQEEQVAQAIGMIEGLTKEVKVGEEYEGEVRRIQPFGCFVEILPGKEGLVHISQMAPEFVKDPGDLVKIGEKVKVRVAEIDDMGRINLSMLFGEEAERAKQRPSGRPPRRPPSRKPLSRRTPSKRFEKRPSGKNGFPTSSRFPKKRPGDW